MLDIERSLPSTDFEANLAIVSRFASSTASHTAVSSKGESQNG